MFRYYNANSHNRNVKDCAIRSISLATGKSWDYTYKELSEAARKKGMMMDNVKFLEDYLDDRYDRLCFYSHTIREFIEENPYGTYIISMPGHLTCVIDGINYDTFSTLDRTMWCAWVVK